MDTAEAAVRGLLEEWSEGIRQKDIDRLMAVYSPGIVYFDVVPPLRLVGANAVRANFVRWFDTWSTPIGVDIRDLSLDMNDGLAAAHMLHRTSGTLKTGRNVGYWIRASVTCRHLEKGWRLTHEHVSLPVEFPAGQAAMALEP
jgi:ketosteroid isomerase-like protein